MSITDPVREHEIIIHNPNIDEARRIARKNDLAITRTFAALNAARTDHLTKERFS